MFVLLYPISVHVCRREVSCGERSPETGRSICLSKHERVFMFSLKIYKTLRVDVHGFCLQTTVKTITNCIYLVTFVAHSLRCVQYAMSTFRTRSSPTFERVMWCTLISFMSHTFPVIVPPIHPTLSLFYATWWFCANLRMFFAHFSYCFEHLNTL